MERKGPGQASLRTLLRGLPQPLLPSWAAGRSCPLPQPTAWATASRAGHAGGGGGAGHEAEVRIGDRQLDWKDTVPGCVDRDHPICVLGFGWLGASSTHILMTPLLSLPA